LAVFFVAVFFFNSGIGGILGAVFVGIRGIFGRCFFDTTLETAVFCRTWRYLYRGTLKKYRGIIPSPYVMNLARNLQQRLIKNLQEYHP
jgi:hypothetical protein